MLNGRYFVMFASAALVAAWSCNKDSGGSSSSGFCTPDGQKCTGVDAYAKCTSSCEKAADCGDACSDYKSCVSKCDCDSAASCASNCESKITDDCQTCLGKVDECVASKCTAPECTEATTTKGTGGTSGGTAGTSGSGGSSGSGGTHTCSQLSSCCSGIVDSSSKADCQDAASAGDADICDTYYQIFCTN